MKRSMIFDRKLLDKMIIDEFEKAEQEIRNIPSNYANELFDNVYGYVRNYSFNNILFEPSLDQSHALDTGERLDGIMKELNNEIKNQIDTYKWNPKANDDEGVMIVEDYLKGILFYPLEYIYYCFNDRPDWHFLMSLTEASWYFGLSSNYIREILKNDKQHILSVKVGKRTKIIRLEFEKYLREIDSF